MLLLLFTPYSYPYVTPRILDCSLVFHSYTSPLCHSSLLPASHSYTSPLCHSSLLPTSHSYTLPLCHSSLLPSSHLYTSPCATPTIFICVSLLLRFSLLFSVLHPLTNLAFFCFLGDESPVPLVGNMSAVPSHQTMEFFEMCASLITQLAR